jgi:predicted RNase H-like nuclease
VRVVGIDGTKGGWVAIELEDGRFSCDHLLRPLETTFEELAEARVVAIDVPIGFGPREADRAARRFLAGNASTVFSTPPRQTLESPFARGRGVSAQSHSLGPRILHVTKLAEADPRFHEVHPEVSFRAMNKGQLLRGNKKSAGGALDRLRLLEANGVDLSGVSEATSAPLDDVLDAAAAAWTAHRIATGVARTLPEPPEVASGRQVAIWY